jgi:hypothetical protein
MIDVQSITQTLSCMIEILSRAQILLHLCDLHLSLTRPSTPALISHDNAQSHKLVFDLPNELSVSYHFFVYTYKRLDQRQLNRIDITA